MNHKLAVAIVFLLSVQSGLMAGEMPLVYDREDTGADCPMPPLPEFSELPSIPYLPNPFMKADGRRITNREEWRCRRAEIKAMIERYDVGEKPGKPSVFKATLQGNTITITVGEGTNTFNMTATLNRPDGAPDAPVPAVIGMNTPTGSLPPDFFSKRGIATITYRAGQVAPVAFGGITYESGNFMKLHPNATAGYMIRWAWVDALAAREVWKALGVPDRMGVTEEQIGHCQWHPGFAPALEAYLDKFLLGKQDVNTDILRSRFTDVDRAKWIPWTAPELE